MPTSPILNICFKSYDFILFLKKKKSDVKLTFIKFGKFH